MTTNPATQPPAAGEAAHTLTEDSPAYWNLPGAIPAVPGPYRVEHSNPGPGGFFRIMSRGQTEHGLPVAGSGCRIASLGYGGNQEVSHRATAAANAAFIVRACNSHADLVEALEAAEERILELSKWANIPAEGQTLDEIRAALAAAKQS